MNIYMGVYYFVIVFCYWGVNWDVVGVYNVGFVKNIK